MPTAPVAFAEDLLYKPVDERPRDLSHVNLNWLAAILLRRRHSFLR